MMIKGGIMNKKTLSSNKVMVGIQDTRSMKQDKKISIAIMSPFVILTIQYLILYYFNLVGGTLGSKVQLISKLLVGLLFLVGLPVVLKRNLFLLISVYAASTFIFIYNYFVFNESSHFLSTLIFPLFFICLPAFLYSYSIRDRRVFVNIVEKAATIVLIVGMLISILVFTGRVSLGLYSMSLSYYMLLPAIVYLKKILKNKSLKDLMLILIILTIILLLGSRGPIMCISAYMILYIIVNRPKLTYKIVTLYLGLTSLLVVIAFNFRTIFLSMYNLLLSFGIDSRTLLLFARPKVHLSGREILYQDIISQIKESPLLGIGIAGDRLYIGGYVHNILLEIIAGFGVIVGSILIIILIWICYKAIRLRNRDDSNLAIIWISIGLIPLLVSGTYLADFHFWIFLGITLNIIFQKE